MLNRVLIAGLMIITSTAVNATSGGGDRSVSPDSLSKITDFANSICGKVIEAGSSSTTISEFDLSDLSDQQKRDLIDVLKKQFEQVQLNVNTDNQTVSTSRYKGVNLDQVASVNTAIRNCRKEIAIKLLRKQ